MVIQNVYPVWIEGFETNGERSEANFLGKYAADSFIDACRLAAEKKYEDMSLFDVKNGVPCYWGCGMFDNESDARRYFG